MTYFMKAESYLDRKTGKPKYNPIGYFVSEKFDGQRAQWDPETQQLYSRYGNTIGAPDWFLEHLRPITKPLDGEIWFGYGGWGFTGIARAKSKQAQRENEKMWEKAKYMVFDIPDPNAGTYRERIAQLKNLPGHPIELVQRKLVTDKGMLKTFYEDILSRGGEGVMLNNPESYYQDGRTDNIIKYKPVMDDECVVVGYKPGTGRNAGRLGAFIVRPIEDGRPIKAKEFRISGMSDVIRTNYKRTHPLATVLRYSCRDYTTTGKPRHPVYLGKCDKQRMSEEEREKLKKELGIMDDQSQNLSTVPVPVPAPRIRLPKNLTAKGTVVPVPVPAPRKLTTTDALLPVPAPRKLTTKRTEVQVKDPVQAPARRLARPKARSSPVKISVRPRASVKVI